MVFGYDLSPFKNLCQGTFSRFFPKRFLPVPSSGCRHEPLFRRFGWVWRSWWVLRAGFELSLTEWRRDGKPVAVLCCSGRRPYGILALSIFALIGKK